MISRKSSVRLGAFALAALAVGTVSTPKNVSACDAQPYIGSICLTAIPFCPRGYTEASGGLASIAIDGDLFSLFGTTYGGDGKTNFALPDLRGREVVGSGYGIDLMFLKQGQRIGDETKKMMHFEIPDHTHVISLSGMNHQSIFEGTSETANTTYPDEALFAISQASTAYAKTSNTTMAPDAFTTTVGAVSGMTSSTPPSEFSPKPFSILGPQLGLRVCIAVDGTYPSRS